MAETTHAREVAATGALLRPDAQRAPRCRDARAADTMLARLVSLRRAGVEHFPLATDVVHRNRPVVYIDLTSAPRCNANYAN